MNLTQFIVPESGRRKRRRAEPGEFRSVLPLRVLFVGPEHLRDAIHNALAEGLRSRIFATRDCQELWLLPVEEPFRLAILHHALSALDLEGSSRVIRRRWPRARILVIRSGRNVLDDALYDELLAAPVAAGALLQIVRQMLSTRCA
jgi:hypothetical protein